jgi:hypothetical protein
MRSLLALVVLVGCTTGEEGMMTGSGVCSLDDAADVGTLSALKAQRCNVPMSMGQRKWFRLSATLPSSTMDIVQLDLWHGLGAFSAGAVTTGTFQLAGPELDFATCGVCLRGIGDKGTGDVKEYFATGGTVNVTAIGMMGEAISATITNATFAEVNAQHQKVMDGCDATIARVQIDGVVMDMGGGGGGGGGGGSGSGNCPTTVGD